MSAQASSNESLVLSYLGLRTAVGAIGIALPFVLALGKMLFESPGLQNSISDYYYTGMRNIFVGSLCAIGVFMLSYHGYDRGDDIGGDFAGLFAIGVALCPTTPEVDVRSYDRILGILHLVFAGGFLLTLAYFSLVLFRKTDPRKIPTPRKLQRNSVYKACGYAILACLALIAVAKLVPLSSMIERLNPVFWLESLAIVAFGLSWFTKGEAILGDLT